LTESFALNFSGRAAARLDQPPLNRSVNNYYYYYYNSLTELSCWQILDVAITIAKFVTFTYNSRCHYM